MRDAFTAPARARKKSPRCAAGGNAEPDSAARSRPAARPGVTGVGGESLFFYCRIYIYKNARAERNEVGKRNFRAALERISTHFTRRLDLNRLSRARAQIVRRAPTHHRRFLLIVARAHELALECTRRVLR